MKDLDSFIALKYQLPTADNFQREDLGRCQELLDTYPGEVVSNWAWRCAEDVEHLATTPKSKEVYRIARLLRAGKATKEELDKMWETAVGVISAAAYAALVAQAPAGDAARAAYTYAAYCAAYHAAYAGTATKDGNIKWALYRDWLIEELCKYET